MEQLKSLGSDLERAFDTQFERLGQDLPKPESNITLIKGRNFKFDRVWRLEELVVELEGGAQGRRIICHNCGEIVRAKRADGTIGKEIRAGGWHQARQRFFSDIEKYNLLTSAGFKLLRFTQKDVFSYPFEMVNLIRENLQKHVKCIQLIEELSKKEIEVLHLIAAGMKTNQIAVRLDLAENTVRTHSQNICEKLIAANRTAAIARAAAWGLLDFDKVPFSDEVIFTLD